MSGTEKTKAQAEQAKADPSPPGSGSIRVPGRPTHPRTRH